MTYGKDFWIFTEAAFFALTFFLGFISAGFKFIPEVILFIPRILLEQDVNSGLKSSYRIPDFNAHHGRCFNEFVSSQGQVKVM